MCIRDRSYTEDLDEDGNTKSSEDDEEKAAEEEAMEAVENGPLTEERRQELLKIRRDGLKDVYKRQPICSAACSSTGMPGSWRAGPCTRSPLQTKSGAMPVSYTHLGGSKAKEPIWIR